MAAGRYAHSNADEATRMAAAQVASGTLTALLQSNGIPLDTETRNAGRALFRYMAENRGHDASFYVGHGAPSMCPICNGHFLDNFRRDHPNEAVTLQASLPPPDQEFSTADCRGMRNVAEHVRQATDAWHRAAASFLDEVHPSTL